MNSYFFDSSGLVKRYNKETGTSFVLQIYRPSSQNTIYIAQISQVEVTSALARRLNQPNSRQHYQKAIRRFERDVENRFSVFKTSEEIITLAVQLAKNYRLRGYDAVQLATALKLENELVSLGLSSSIFISADNDLNTAAEAENLTVENPNNYP